MSDPKLMAVAFARSTFPDASIDLGYDRLEIEVADGEVSLATLAHLSELLATSDVTVMSGVGDYGGCSLLTISARWSTANPLSGPPARS